MKTKFLFLLIALSTLSLTAINSPINQIEKTVEVNFLEQIKGVFDGSDEYGYTFILTLDDGEGIIFTFNALEKEVSEQYNLESEDLLGKSFLITFETLIEASNNEKEEEIYTITSLEVI